jgi:hypothetical protein
MNRNPIRRGLMALTLVLALAALLLAAPAEAHPMTFYNQSNYVITEFYFDWAQSDQWTNDVLGNQVLNPGEALSLGHGGHCWWDIMLVLYPDTELQFEESVDFCEVSEIYFYCNEETCWLTYE